MAASSPIAEAWCCSYYVGGDAEDLDVGDDGGQQPEQVTGKAGLQGGLFQLGAESSRSLEVVWR